jgi:hypothetical protein
MADGPESTVLSSAGRPQPIECPVPIKAQRRSPCQIAGVIQDIGIDLRKGTGSIEATASDRIERMVVKWRGLKPLSGIRPESGLILEVTMGEGSRKQLQELNPESPLFSASEHG